MSTSLWATTAAEVYSALGRTDRRRAFHHVLQAAVDWRGQVITMLDRAYLAESMPCLVVWGEQDTVIPVKHAYAAHSVLPGSQLEVIPHAGHFPHEDDPEHFASAMIDFILDTKPAKYDGRAWVKALASGPRPRKFWASRPYPVAILKQLRDAGPRHRRRRRQLRYRRRATHPAH